MQNILLILVTITCFSTSITAEFHRVHAEFHGVFLVAPAVQRVHGGRLFLKLGSLTFIKCYYPWLDLKQDFPRAQTPATAGGKLLKTKKLRETLRVLCETLR